MDGSRGGSIPADQGIVPAAAANPAPLVQGVASYRHTANQLWAVSNGRPTATAGIGNSTRLAYGEGRIY
jgi:hypothetical protein